MTAKARRRSAGSAPKVLTFTDSASGPTGSNPYTYANMAIGPAAPDRRVHVALVGQIVPGSISSITIGGVAATINIQIMDATSAYALGFATALVPTGTTANVVITFSGGATRQYCGVWTSTGLTSNTPFDSISSDADANPASVTVATLNEGFAIFAVISNGNTSTTSWTIATENYDLNGDGNASGASISATTGANVTPTASFSANSSRAMLGMSF